MTEPCEETVISVDPDALLSQNKAFIAGIVQATKEWLPDPYTLEMPKRKPFVHQIVQAGRNDPCPCGSGKKFKKCCRP